MPDDKPIDPAVIVETGEASEKAAEKLGFFSESMSRASSAISGMASMQAKATGFFSGLSTSIQDAGISLNTIGTISEQQVTKFSLLSIAALGARESYTHLANVDMGNLNSFGQQFQQLTEIINNNGPASKVGKESIDLLIGGMKRAGSSTSDIAAATMAAMSGSIDLLSSYAKGVATHADNQLRLNNAVIQYAAQTGDLNNLMAIAGTRFENINAVAEKQAEMFNRVRGATNVTSKELEEYYSQLGTIPGAMTSMVKSSGDASDSVDMLTAAIKVAKGSGRSFKDVSEDMKSAFEKYGVVGEDALKFSARIGEVTQNLGVSMSTVRGALTSAADGFKIFANAGADAAKMTEGISGIMNSYAKALEGAGVPGVKAVDITKDMINHLGKLDVAQRAFLSSQTGGPGGLMGAFQIEDMLRKGDISGVMEKVRTQMSKQMGGIVGIEEATTSEGAAAQRQKQISLLTQGPLKLTDDASTAGRILDAFKAREDGKVDDKGLKDNILKETMDKGTLLQEKTATGVNEIVNHVAALHTIADRGALGFMQQAFTAAGDNKDITPSQRENIARIRRGMQQSATVKGSEGGTYAGSMKSGVLIDNFGRTAIAEMQSAVKLIGDMGPMLKTPMETISQLMKSPNKMKPEEQYNQIRKLEEHRDKLKTEMSHAPLDKKHDIAEVIRHETAAIEAAKKSLAARSGEVQSPGMRVGAAAGHAVDARQAQHQTQAQTTATHEQHSSEVDIRVTGFCVKCKNDFDLSSKKTNSRQRAINPAAAANRD